MENNISIIICTYNRSQYLKANIESIIKHGAQYKSVFELLIVDNNSIDDTYNCYKNLLEEGFNFKYVKEESQGLSYARNTGVKNACHEWLYFVDDDMLFLESTFPELFRSINSGFMIFGGLFSPYFVSEKPRWISNDFRKKRTLNKSFKDLHIDEYISGGNMIINKSIFQKIGCFNTLLGMKGNLVGYYEEIEFQKRAKEKGFQLGMNPNLHLYEVIRPEKLTVSWLIYDNFALGRDWAVQNKKFKVSVLRSLFNCTKGLFIALKKLMLCKEYYIQNALVDGLKSAAFDLGVIRTTKKLRL